MKKRKLAVLWAFTILLAISVTYAVLEYEMTIFNIVRVGKPELDIQVSENADNCVLYGNTLTIEWDLQGIKATSRDIHIDNRENKDLMMCWEHSGLDNRYFNVSANLIYEPYRTDGNIYNWEQNNYQPLKANSYCFIQIVLTNRDAPTFYYGTFEVYLYFEIVEEE
jgi:hypothetical protein